MTLPSNDNDPIIGRLADGQGVVYSTHQGPYLEYCPDEETDEVFCVVFGPDVIAQFGLTLEDVHDLCESQDEDPVLWRNKAHSADPLARAECVVDIGHHVGWEEIDDDPVTLNRIQRQKRWWNMLTLTEGYDSGGGGGGGLCSPGPGSPPGQGGGGGTPGDEKSYGLGEKRIYTDGESRGGGGGIVK